MNNITDYQIVDQIAKGLKTNVYRAIDKNQKPVILKVLKQEFSDSERIARFKREFEITSSLDSNWTIKAFDLIKHNNNLVMVLEDFGGISLKDYLVKNSPVHDEEQLRINLNIAKLTVQALADIHKNNIIHKDINSSNIIYNTNNNQLKIIDFGLATELLFERFDKQGNNFEGTYAYLSPEQTGRLNRDIDYRSDYYSLGITLYELFSGQLPFHANSSREWIHCHIAKEPVHLHELYNNIPKGVSDIILKLIQKNAEDRYQSSYGLIKDIENCIKAIDKPQAFQNYRIGQFDISQKFQVPQKLYGRKEEIKKLVEVFENVSQGNPSCILIKGYSGIGKTSLVGEIKRPIIDKNGNFITGKFDQFKSDIPYSALIQAFSSIVSGIITETQEEINHWKNKILEAIPNNAQLIIDVIPELELIIGKQPTLPSLTASETQNRFDITFQKFFQLFVEKDHPLVIFLDDLHWADATSLDMILKILKTSESKPIFVLGAYRDREVKKGHPLIQLINSLMNSEIQYSNIELGEIKESDINELLKDAFVCNRDETKQLSKLCYEKTRGNPFFLTEFISNLVRNSYIKFNSEIGKWTWDISQIKKTDVTENVADLISQRLSELPKDSLEIMKLASCFGTRFDLSALSIVSEKSWTQVIDELKIPLKESLILPLEESYLFAEYSDKPQVTYRFVHDRVQHSAYQLLSKHDMVYIHLKIGRLLLKKSSEKQIDENLFIILGHLNKGISLIEDDERKLLAKYNLKACRKAKASGAFKPANHYAEVGLKLLPKNSWLEQYKLTFSLYAEAAETASLCGNHEEMEFFLSECSANAKNLLDKTKIHEIRTHSLIARNEQQKAIKETLILLKLLGIKFPLNVGTHHVLFNLFRTRSLIRKIKLEKLSILPQMEDPEILTAMQNMANIISVLFRTDPNLFTLVVFKLIQLTIKYGVAPISPVSFITFGLITNVIFGDIPRAYELGKLGMKLFERIDDKTNWAQAYYLYNVAIAIWKEPLNNANDNLLKAYKVAQEIGDFEYMMSAAAARAHYLFRAGSELKELISSTENYKQSISHVYKEITYSQFDVLIQMFTNFVIPSDKPEELISEKYDERKLIDYHLKDKDDTSIIMIYLDKLTLAYYFERYGQALEILKNSKKYLKGINGLLMYVNYHYFESLTLLAQYNDLNSKEKRKAKKKILSNQKKMKKWANHAPMNFLCKYKLVEAEKERYLGDCYKVESLYEEAILLSQKNSFIHEEALANELAAKYWMSVKNEKFAKEYITKAHQLYNIWGASAKSQSLRQKYPNLIITTLTSDMQGDYTQSPSSSSSQISLSVDMETILDAAKTISSEIVLSELLKKTLTIILEHAGAQKGSLLIKNLVTNDLIIEAEGIINQGNIEVLLKHKEISENNIPVPLIRYIERSNKMMILHNAEKEGDFITNNYIKDNHIKSVIAIPIVKQTKLLGILYLENNLSPYVFTKQKVNILTILCTQIAISLENAQVYNTLEQKVKERTVEVLKQKEEIQSTAKELKRTNEQLKILNATKDKLFSIIAHDLKNPFNIIIGYSSYLAEEIDGITHDEIKGAIEKIHNSSNSAFELLQNLLEWSRNQVGRIQCKPQKIVLKNIVDKNIRLHYNNAQTKDIKLVNNIFDDITAFADENMINTVIRNLLSNALKFTEKGGVVNINANKNNDFVEIIIEDNGVGIDGENIEKLFRLDISFSTTGTADEKGTGLGLILCKEFINKNGGEIDVESEIGKGTTFKFTLPVK